MPCLKYAPASKAFDESKRVCSLNELKILDTAPESEFDEIVQLASLICDTSGALITFVDSHRTWFKAKVGFAANEVPRAESVCADVIAQTKLVCIPDLRTDVRYAKKLTVVSAPHLRFYAGLPIYSSDGQPVGALCVVDSKVKELSARQKSGLVNLGKQVSRLLANRIELQELRLSELALRYKETAVDSLSEGVILQDGRGTVMDFNPAALEVLGLSASELTGRTNVNPKWRAIKEDGSEFPGPEYPALKALETGQKQLNVIMGIFTNTQELRWISVSSVPLRFKKSKDVTHVVSSFTDMTNLRKLDNDKQVFAQKLNEAARLSALGEVAGGIAHEINNPLAVIQGKAAQIEQRILKNSEVQLAQNDLKTIEKNVQRIAKIIKGLLTYARDGEQDPFREASFSQIVEETLDLCRERYKKNHVELTISQMSDAIVECRSSQISQILLNLLNNSFDAVIGRQDCWVKVQVTVEANSILMFVQDSGPGIPASDLKKLAQPFFTTKALGKGTGLGLSISRRLAESHNGSLEYVQGAAHTTFLLTLPRRQSSNDKDCDRGDESLLRSK